MCEKQYLPGTETTRLISREKPLRVVATAAFDDSDPRVKALEIEEVSTFYCESCVSVDIAGVGWDGLEYQTRIVVGKVRDGWYAIPRCRSSESFYRIADSMSLARAETKEAR